MNMPPDEFAIATGGITAPWWLPALNEWVALIVGLMSIVYLGYKIWRMK